MLLDEKEGRGKLNDPGLWLEKLVDTVAAGGTDA